MSGRLEALIVLAGLAAAFWTQTKSVLAWVRSWVLVTKKLDYQLANLVLAYMEATMTRVASPNPAYGSMSVFVRPLDRIHRVVFQALHGGTQLFRRGLRFVWYSADSVSTNEAQGSRREYTQSFTFVRGLLDWEALLLQATDWEDGIKQGKEKQNTRFRVHYHYGSGGFGEMLAGQNGVKKALSDMAAPSSTNETYVGYPSSLRLLRWSHEDVFGFPVVSTMDNLSLCPDLVKAVEELRFWLGAQQWYAQHGVPWRRGVVFHGPPGTGKTSLARALAEELDLPVHVFDLAGMSNQDLKRAWREMLTTAPCMALVEDLDAVFEGRKNVAVQSPMGGGGLTFDCLLNCIDGIERVDGLLTVISTNHIELMDPALVDRPGRIDRRVEFRPLDHDGRVKMATRILDDPDLAQTLALAHPDDSAARFQERCFQKATARLYAGEAS